MGWTVEQNTGIAGQVTRCIWFKGYIYAFTENQGIWRRDGVGPWTQVFAFATGGQAWLWEDDDAIYCGGGLLNGNCIYRSEDGTVWTLDVDLNVTFGLQAFYHDYSEIGGYGSYLYLANHDVAGAGATYFYRRNLAGIWTTFGVPFVGVEGASGRGIIGFGGEVYWTNATNARYWDGAAWSIETTLDGQGGTYLSLIDYKLYVRCSTSYSLIGGYYWKTAPATDWSWLNLPVPNNTWATWTLCEGADGEIYTLTTDGTVLRIYQRVGPLLDLIGYQPTTGLGLGTRGGICVDATGAMYWGTRATGTIRFFAFVGIYNLTPGGLYPQAMDCDGDGDALYIGLYDTATAQPILISVPLPLDGALSVGSAMFNPGAGTAINVKCNDIGNNLVISGSFAAANEQVESSNDAGLTWTDIDRDAWGAEVAQPLLVDPDSIAEVMVALQTAQDITETDDAGATAWTVNNAAVGYGIQAMARLPDGDELVIGDAHAARKVEYSPNRGVTLQDITGGVALGNIVALEVA